MTALVGLVPCEKDDPGAITVLVYGPGCIEARYYRLQDPTP